MSFSILDLFKDNTPTKSKDDDVTITDVISFLAAIIRVYGKELPSGTNVMTTISDVAFLACTSVQKDDIGPICIVPAILDAKGVTTNIYLVSLGGTEFVNGQATDIKTDVLSAFEQDNDYVDAIKKAMLSFIPKGSTVIVSGYSLGGMVAQQIASDKEIKDAYVISNIIGIGSPLINPTKREGIVKRMCDKNDVVPYLSVASVFLNWLYQGERVEEDGGYKTPIGAHALSYVDSSVWYKYDVLGMKNGGATIRFEKENLKYFFAPLD